MAMIRLLLLFCVLGYVSGGLGTVTVGFSPKKLVQGCPVVVSCGISEGKVTAYEWSDDLSDFMTVGRQTSKSFTTDALTSEYNGKRYKCKTTLQDGATAEGEATITVVANSADEVKPVVEVPDVVLADKKVTLKCNSPAVCTGMTYKWWSKWDLVHDATEKTLEITSPGAGSAMTYKCISEIGGVASVYSDWVEVAPTKVFLSSSKDKIVVGCPLQVTCNAQLPGTGDLSYQWFIGDSGQPSDTDTSKSLSIDASENPESVNYQCAAKLSGGRNADYVKSTVKTITPVLNNDVTMTPIVQVPDVVIENTAVTLTCISPASCKAMTYKWWSVTDDGDKEVKGEDTKTLDITAPVAGQTIKYKCQSLIALTGSGPTSTPTESEFSVTINITSTQAAVVGKVEKSAGERTTNSLIALVLVSCIGYLMTISSVGQLDDIFRAMINT